MNKLNGIFIIPTGTQASIGGDASALAHVNLIANCCNILLANPNSVNASDLNTMADNVWYTEGSTIDRFLSGEINLKETKTYNKIGCLVNGPITPGNINSINASKWVLGADIELVELKTPLYLEGFLNEDDSAGGKVIGWEALVEQVKDLDFDIITVQTPIQCDPELANRYWKGEIKTNIWGRCEAMLSKLVSQAINKQCVHSPIEFLQDNLYNKTVVKMSQAPEIISNTYSHCMFKGSLRAPKIDITKDSRNLSNKDIDFLVSPYLCWAEPHDSCIKNNIPLIIVKENTTCFKNFKYPDSILNNKNIIFVNNYLEAAGVISCLSAGIDYRTILL